MELRTTNQHERSNYVLVQLVINGVLTSIKEIFMNKLSRTSQLDMDESLMHVFENK